MKGGIGCMKPKHFWGWLRPERVLSDVPVSRNWFKTVSMLNQNYTYEIWYSNLSFKQIIFSKYATNLKTTITQRSLNNLGLLLVLEFNTFSFLLDIIDTSVLREQNFQQWQCSIMVTWCRRRHVTMILLGPSNDMLL